MLSDILLWLTRHLYPTGKVWKLPFGGYLEGLHIALAKSEARTYNDCIGVLNSILPDNDNFTAQDATDWERRLGLITAPGVSLDDRKMAIAAKMARGGVIGAHQHYLFLQSLLQENGFDVYVYENIFPDGMGGYTTRNALDVSAGVGAAYNAYGEFAYGEAAYGVFYQNIIANYIDESRDWLFNIGDSLVSTFFIGGSNLGDFANVPIERKAEFRQLILKLKPAHNVGYLLINYT